MATYPGMNLRGEVRESVSLDEEDLSDVEDEVFIRDGKSGYKFEDMSAKKPLMAPRRKVYKSEIGGKFRNKPQCKVLCRLCCYAFIALTVLIGLIVLVVILVSLFPLPLDKLKEWIISKTNEKEPSQKLVPCNNLNITDVWTINFPKLVSDTSVQIVDVNLDGVDDIIFGFGTSDDNALPPDVFCNIFMGKEPPCQGGVMALNGTDGQVLWRSWLHSTVYTLACTVDVNGDNITDCLITGKDGIFFVLNSQNGSVIWNFDDKLQEPLELNIYLANFIPDQDNDTVPDILASHSSQQGLEKHSCLLVISGKTGLEIQRLILPKNVETYYTPQLLQQTDGNHSVLFGTGSLTKPGNLSVISLKDLILGNTTFQVIYKDSHKGVLSEAVLVDITGDGQDDIVTALLNSTVVAIDGRNFTQIWNYTIPNSETLSAPTPGYFNSDNVTDFMVKYQTGREYPVYYYSQMLIIDGKTGKPIYKPTIDNAGLQTNGLTISLDGYGNDLFLYWMNECKNFEDNLEMFEFVPGSNIHQQIRSDLCKLRFNSSISSKLYALNQFDQPPGVEVYNSESRIGLEYNNTVKPMEEVRAYLEKYPDVQFSVLESNTATSNSYHPSTDDYEPSSEFKVEKYKDRSSFRHKDNGQGLIRDFGRDSLKGRNNLKPIEPKFEPDYESLPEDWPQKPAFPNSEIDADYKSYPEDLEGDNIYSPNKHLLLNQNIPNSNRDPRSKPITVISKPNGTEKVNKTMKKNLSDSKPNIYDYKNMERAHTRLLHDLNNLPNEILSETYFKNRENQLRKSRFEERDLKSHEDHIRENENIKKVIELEKSKLVNMSASLWDLESEKELQDRDSGYWREKREVNSSVVGIPKLSSIGALTSSFNSSDQSIDLIFITSWVLPKREAQILLPKDFDCINEKLKQEIDSKGSSRTIDKKQMMEELFMKQCLESRGVVLNRNMRRGSKFAGNENFRKFPYLNQVPNLGLGQLTVYRLKLKCLCRTTKKNEKCVTFLQSKEQRWGSYLGRSQNGIFKVKQ